MDWQTHGGCGARELRHRGASRSRCSAGAPATGAWREGDAVGDRRFVGIGDLALESGARACRASRIAYENWGALSPARDNAVLVLHALTGDSHVVGPAGPAHPSAGWWPGIVGPGPRDRHRPLVRRRAQHARRVPGLDRSRLPRARRRRVGRRASRSSRSATRSRAQLAFARALGIERFAAVVGGSMGGHARARVGHRGSRRGRAHRGARGARRRPPPTRSP